MIRLCVTADDYGLSPDINAGIESIAARGAVSAVSVMVHPEATLHGIDALRRQVVTGLHLMLVGERPLLADRLAPILDADGFLPMRYWGLLLALARHPRCLPLLADEIGAQIARYRSLGLSLHFINSHQHVHLLPPIWHRLLEALDRDRSVPAIRTAHRAPFGDLRQALVTASARWAWRQRPLPGRMTLESIDLGFAGRSTLRTVDRALRHVATAPAPPPATVLHELVVHPGLEVDPPAARHAAWGIQWRREHDLFLSNDFQEILRRHVAAVVPPDAVATALGSS